jgi:hypothetical protein
MGSFAPCAGPGPVLSSSKLRNRVDYNGAPREAGRVSDRPRIIPQSIPHGWPRSSRCYRTPRTVWTWSPRSTRRGDGKNRISWRWPTRGRGSRRCAGSSSPRWSWSAVRKPGRGSVAVRWPRFGPRVRRRPCWCMASRMDSHHRTWSSWVSSARGTSNAHEPGAPWICSRPPAQPSRPAWHPRSRDRSQACCPTGWSPGSSLPSPPHPQDPRPQTSPGSVTAPGPLSIAGCATPAYPQQKVCSSGAGYSTPQPCFATRTADRSRRHGAWAGRTPQGFAIISAGMPEWPFPNSGDLMRSMSCSGAFSKRSIAAEKKGSQSCGPYHCAAQSPL